MKAVNDFTIDFQTHDYDHDAKLARAFLDDTRSKLLPDDPGAFVVSDTRSSAAGWSFGKLFLSLEFVQKLYEENSYEIETSKGVLLEDKFIAWLNRLLISKGCMTLVLKAGDEMRDFGRFSAGRPHGFSK